jgi:predicted RNase H-like nuclease (RuvC/YqgF family)
MTRPALVALIVTLTDARNACERQARLSGTKLRSVETLDRELMFLETDLQAMDEAADELVAELPRTRLALSERGRVLPDYEEVEA